MFLGWVPAIAASAGTRDWIVAIVLGAIALVWNAQYVRMFRALVGAEPVDAPAIRSRFAQLAKECGLPEVTLHQVPLRGGSFTNAVALPSTYTPAVVVTDTLLARFDEDEVTAILAHELAHHEHFKPRLRQATIAVWLVIAVAVLLPTVVRLAALPGICVSHVAGCDHDRNDASPAANAETRNPERPARGRSHARSRGARSRIDETACTGPNPAEVGCGVRAPRNASEPGTACPGHSPRLRRRVDFAGRAGDVRRRRRHGVRDVSSRSPRMAGSGVYDARDSLPVPARASDRRAFIAEARTDRGRFEGTAVDDSAPNRRHGSRADGARFYRWATGKARGVPIDAYRWHAAGHTRGDRRRYGSRSGCGSLRRGPGVDPAGIAGRGGRRCVGARGCRLRLARPHFVAVRRVQWLVGAHVGTWRRGAHRDGGCEPARDASRSRSQEDGCRARGFSCVELGDCGAVRRIGDRPSSKRS